MTKLLMVSFCAVLFPRDVLDEILNLIESVSEGFPTYFSIHLIKGFSLTEAHTYFWTNLSMFSL